MSKKFCPIFRKECYIKHGQDLLDTQYNSYSGAETERLAEASRSQLRMKIGYNGMIFKHLFLSDNFPALISFRK